MEITGMTDLDDKTLSSHIIDLFHRIILHHGLWFAETIHQLGPEKAMEILDNVLTRSFQIQATRMGDFIMDMPVERKKRLARELAVNWLANDGIWFQAIEKREGMNDAKRCNDSCWGQFSPVEAHSIARFLSLPPSPGLEGLKKALQFRLYAHINTQSFVDDSPSSFIFRMNECRVQVARKRKGMADYPCKSAGLVEYTYFARTIDPRIKTECVACPPDEHPGEWYCAWRFYID